MGDSSVSRPTPPQSSSSSSTSTTFAWADVDSTRFSISSLVPTTRTPDLILIPINRRQAQWPLRHRAYPLHACRLRTSTPPTEAAMIPSGAVTRRPPSSCSGLSTRASWPAQRCVLPPHPGLAQALLKNLLHAPTFFGYCVIWHKNPNPTPLAGERKEREERDCSVVSFSCSVRRGAHSLLPFHLRHHKNPKTLNPNSENLRPCSLVSFIPKLHFRNHKPQTRNPRRESFNYTS